MDGPLVPPFAWLFSLFCVWVYRRLIERVAAPDRAFERWCAAGPLVASVRCFPGQAGEVRARLLASLGGRSEAVSTLGPLPCPHYRLLLSIDAGPADVVSVRVTGCRLLRPHQRPIALLPAVCQAAGLSDPQGSPERQPGAVLWLDEHLYQETLSALAAPQGWLSVPSAPGSLRLEPADELPGWAAGQLAAAERGLVAEAASGAARGPAVGAIGALR